MGAILRCCGYYCSTLMFLGVIYFGILMVLIAADNEFLNQSEVSKLSKSDRYMALGISMGVSILSFSILLIRTPN
jgi:hypothetical protein